MPGRIDDWNRVHLNTRLAAMAGHVTSALSTHFRSLRGLRSSRANRAGAPPYRRRGVGIAALIAVFAVATSGTVAYGAAHKTITLDVDGVVTHMTTYAGSVQGVLEPRSIAVGSRDTVAPEATSSLRDGSEIVVRHAKLVKVQVDGVKTDVWSTALTAGEALETFASRGDDVRLVASRSSSSGRAELPIELTRRGPVDVTVDGRALTARDGSHGVAAVLEQLGITLTDLDRVSVQHSATGAVTVVVNRVVVTDVIENLPIAFASVSKPDAGVFVGQTKVATAGVPGQRTTVNRVTTVDAVQTGRELLSDTVTVAPVGEVVSVGSKVRPVAPAPKAAAPKAAAPAAPAAAPSPNVGGSADSLNWAALAGCESGGRVNAVSASGAYYGLYQFSKSTWAAVGGSGLPSAASADEQTLRAKTLYNRSGAGQWPVCGAKLFG